MSGLVITYDDLTESIKNYARRYDDRFVATIPLFVRLAERRVATELKLLELKETVVITQRNMSDSLVGKPANWRSTQEVLFVRGDPGTIGDKYIVLQCRLKDFCDQMINAPDADPMYYCEIDNLSFQIFPALNLNRYKWHLMFTYYSTITENGRSNIILENFPELLLYGSLLETATFLGDDERVAVWKQYFDTAKQAALNEDLLRNTNALPNNH